MKIPVIDDFNCSPVFFTQKPIVVRGTQEIDNRLGQKSEIKAWFVKNEIPNGLGVQIRNFNIINAVMIQVARGF